MADRQAAYLTVDDAAKRLHRSPSTVRRWLRSGRLHGCKDEHGGPGGTWRVSEQSCEQMAAQLAAEMNAGIAATVTPQPGIDVIALKVLLELTQALRELTTELQTARKALPPAPEEAKERVGLFRRAWQSLRGGK